MSLYDLQAAIVATLAPLVAPVPVIAHGGPFAEAELPMLLGQAPCVLLSVTGVRTFEPYAPGQWRGVVGFAAVSLGADSGGGRAEQAMDLAEIVLGQLIDQQWGLSDAVCEPPDFTAASADNLYTGRVNNLRVALWAVSWTQPFIFDLPE